MGSTGPTFPERVVDKPEVIVGHRSPAIIARHSRGSSLQGVTLANSSHLGFTAERASGNLPNALSFSKSLRKLKLALRVMPGHGL